MPREPREQYVLQLLRKNWQTDHPFGLTPKLSFGWFDEDQNQPQVTTGLPLPDEGPINGGQTGFSSIDPSGGSPNQTIGGTSQVHCWARYQDLRDDSNVTTNNPREYLSGSAADDGTVSGGVVAEIERILDNNAVSAANPVTGNTPVQSISMGNASMAREPDERGLIHYVVELIYWYGPD